MLIPSELGVAEHVYQNQKLNGSNHRWGSKILLLNLLLLYVYFIIFVRIIPHMDNKLTLKLDYQVISKAKVYARQKKTSLSKLIEAYLKYLTSSGNSTPDEISPLVKSLSGVLKSSSVINDNDAYKKHLAKKYSK